MIHLFLAYFSFIILILLIETFVLIGRKFGFYQLKNNQSQKLEVINVAESAVFALLALLIAFTFTGAYDRYESRKLEILGEISAFETAYNYIDLMPVKYRAELRANVREYLDLNIKVYKDILYNDKIEQDFLIDRKIQEKIWNNAVLASQENSNGDLSQIFISAINNMFDISGSRYRMTKIHPPIIVFGLLIGLAALGAFLVGYNSAENRQKRPIHTWFYVLLTTFTIYTIINLEFPRRGIMSFKSFDQMLITLRENMNKTEV